MHSLFPPPMPVRDRCEFLRGLCQPSIAVLLTICLAFLFDGLARGQSSCVSANAAVLYIRSMCVTYGGGLAGWLGKPRAQQCSVAAR